MLSIAGKDMVIKMIRMTGYTYDENDDMAPVMDAVLKRLGVGVTYGKDEDGKTVVYYEINYYYNPLEYTISFMDGNYVNSDNVSVQNRSGHPLKTVEKVNKAVNVSMDVVTASGQIVKVTI